MGHSNSSQSRQSRQSNGLRTNSKFKKCLLGGHEYYLCSDHVEHLNIIHRGKSIIQMDCFCIQCNDRFEVVHLHTRLCSKCSLLFSNRCAVCNK